jgi:hypothetical protein
MSLSERSLRLTFALTLLAALGCGHKDGADGTGPSSTAVSAVPASSDTAAPTAAATAAAAPVTNPKPATTGSAAAKPDAGTSIPDAGVTDAGAKSDAGAADGGATGPGLESCCTALQQAALSAPLDQKAGYVAAAAACAGLRSAPDAATARKQVRTFLGPAKAPPACWRPPGISANPLPPVCGLDREIPRDRARDHPARGSHSAPLLTARPQPRFHPSAPRTTPARPPRSRS